MAPNEIEFDLTPEGLGHGKATIEGWLGERFLRDIIAGIPRPKSPRSLVALGASIHPFALEWAAFLRSVAALDRGEFERVDRGGAAKILILTQQLSMSEGLALVDGRGREIGHGGFAAQIAGRARNEDKWHQAVYELAVAFRLLCSGIPVGYVQETAGVETPDFAVLGDELWQVECKRFHPHEWDELYKSGVDAVHRGLEDDLRHGEAPILLEVELRGHPDAEVFEVAEEALADVLRQRRAICLNPLGRRVTISASLIEASEFAILRSIGGLPQLMHPALTEGDYKAIFYGCQGLGGGEFEFAHIVVISWRCSERPEYARKIEKKLRKARDQCTLDARTCVFIGLPNREDLKRVADKKVKACALKRDFDAVFLTNPIEYPRLGVRGDREGFGWKQPSVRIPERGTITPWS